MHTLKAVFLILLIGSLAWSEHPSAEILSAKILTADADGWHTWQINEAAPVGLVQVYVNMKHGEPVDIRVLSPECPVSTATKIIDHGLVSTDENLAWFRGVIENPRQDMDVREDALFGLVQSGSDSAFDYLDALLAER